MTQDKSHKDRSKGANKLSKMSSNSGERPVGSKGKQKLPKHLNRRRHTKSRRGCFTCKSRKIKCDEGIPSCSHCVYRGSTCTYPQVVDGRASAALVPSRPGQIFVPFQPEVELRAPPSQKPVFTVQEMRFFHYFLTSMKHPLPLGNRDVWIREIPQISLDYPFLLHAILALGASEMERSSLYLPLRSDVLKHQGRAISGLNKALDDSNSWNTYGHADAVLAACYALIYQSSRISDGMKDFSVLVQGCALITNKIQQSKLKTVLIVSHDWPRHEIDRGLQHIEAKLQDSHMALVKTGLESLHEIQQARALSDAYPFWKACVVTLEHFISSPVEGYTFSITRYSAWYHLAGEMLKALRHQNNWTVFAIVATFMANMILLKVVIPLHTWPEGKRRLPFGTLRRMLHWIEVIDKYVEEPHRRYVAWARHIATLVPELPPETHYDHSRPKLGSSRTDLLDDLPARLVFLSFQPSIFLSQAYPDSLITVSSAHMILGEILRLGSEVTAWFEEFVSDMYQALPSQEQSGEDIQHTIPTSSMPPASSTMPPTNSSLPTVQQSLPSLELPMTHRLMTADMMHDGQDQSDERYSPSISEMNSDAFAFELFSELDQVRNGGHGALRDPDNINDNNNKGFNIFQA